MLSRAYLIVMLAACTPRDRRTPDDTIVMLVDSRLNTEDPRYARTNSDSKLGRLVAAGLTAVDTPDLQARPWLASKIVTVDPVTIDITVRDDARFSDGSYVTADDVAKTYTSVLADVASIAHKNIAERIASVEVIAPKTARFHLTSPIATFLTDIDFGILSFHPGVTGVVGAGPYVLRELDDQHALLDANPYYFEGPPKTPHLDIRVVHDSAARILMMVGGTADIAQNNLRMDLVDEIAERSRVHVSSSPSVLLTYLAMNNDDPMLHDLRVREAIALALDRPAIIAAQFEGRAVLATGLMAPMHPAYYAKVPHWDRDLPRANALLDEAGYKPRADGIRAHLVFKISSDAFRVTIARVIASQLAEVGLEVEVRPFEFETMFADLKKGAYQLGMMQTSEITGPDYYYSYFNSGRIPTEVDPDATNRWRYRNPEVDRLTDAGRHELDPVKRQAIYDDIQRIVATDLPVVPLWHEDNIVLTNVDIEGYAIAPNARFNGAAIATKRL
jgi:peptide/nickel transport system substrate-binding protein